MAGRADLAVSGRRLPGHRHRHGGDPGHAEARGRYLSGGGDLRPARDRADPRPFRPAWAAAARDLVRAHRRNGPGARGRRPDARILSPMRVDTFDFELPEDRIALRPSSPRDSARLLLVPRAGAFDDRSVRDLPDLLRPGDALVLNDTKVIRARLFGLRARGETTARVEIMLHTREG